VSSGNYHYFHE